MVEPVSKFRSSMNALYLKGIFYETTLADKSTVHYTLKDWDHTVDGIVYPSLYRLYMEANDPTEYRFATAHLDSWNHWEKLCSTTWFKEYIDRWRRELELRMKSNALNRIMNESRGDGREAFAANKYLLEKGWEPKDSKGRGRPSKEEITKAANEQASFEKRISDDFDRLQNLKAN